MLKAIGGGVRKTTRNKRVNQKMEFNYQRKRYVGSDMGGKGNRPLHRREAERSPGELPSGSQWA